ncbi:hypothetical protein AGMMS50243_03440 [Betaproteobacteria bacterium]|nr:hypothetical protein AGMMS50243_03440 [Betaproteobacteria bacterium]
MKQARQPCKPARHPLALAVASALALVALPVAAQTSQWRDLGASSAPAVPTTAVNTTQINFGGHEWVVIGNDTKDIYQGTITGGIYFSGAYGNTEASAKQPNGSVTLLLSSSNGGTGYEAGNGFGNSAYRSDACGTTPGDCKANRRNEYNGSTLQGAMDAIAVGLDKEQDVINARTLKPMDAELPGSEDDWKQNDGINGNAAPDQLHWALSFAEWEAIGNNDIRKYPSSWWLRSPGNLDDYALAG